MRRQAVFSVLGLLALALGVFSDLAVADINVYAPNGSDEWAMYTPREIQWTPYGNGTILIHLYKSGSFLQSINPSAPDSGNYEWNVFEWLQLGTDYSVAVWNETTQSYGESARFEITNGVRVTQPTSSSSYQTGDTCQIRWDRFPNTSSGLAYVRIQLFQNGTQVYNILQPSTYTSNDGSHDWVIGDNIATGTYQVAVAGYSDGGNAYDFSDYFQISLVVPCSYSLSSGSSNVGHQNGSGSVSVYTDSHCNWNASESCSWVTITSGSSGTGNGTVYYSYTENPNQSSRSCSITISGVGQTLYHTINQDPAPSQDPAATIQSISPSPSVEGQSVLFSGSGYDPDGGSLTAYSWRSSRDGTLSSSSSFSTSSLSVGYHTIYFKVRDDEMVWSPEVSQGHTVSDEPDPADLSLSGGTVPNPIPAGGGTYSVFVNNLGDLDLNWETFGGPAWGTASPTYGAISGGSSQMVSIQVDQNTDTSGRSGIIYFGNADYINDRESITLNQEGAVVSGYHNYFEEAGGYYFVPYNLLKAMAQVESGWNQGAYNGDDWGIMQLNEDNLLSLAQRLKVDYPTEYGALSDWDMVSLLKEDSGEGAEANIRGAASKLRHDADNVGDLIYDGEPEEALEVWWFVLAYYNGGGADGSLLTSNYPFRVYNCFLSGIEDPVDGTRVPQIPITLPPYVSFQVATQGELDNGEVVAADQDLIPSSPLNMIRRTEAFNACEDLYHLHGNGGEELNVCGNSDPFRIIFPVKNDGPYSTSVDMSSVFDYSFEYVYATDGYVIGYAGTYGWEDYGAEQSYGVWGYRSEDGHDFSSDIPNYSGAYLYYDGHPAYDFSYAAGTELRATADGEVVYTNVDTGVLRIDHGNSFFTEYRHCDHFLKNNGEEVKQGEEVAESGSQDTLSAHLHFEVYKDIGGVLHSVDPYGWQAEEAHTWTRAINATLWQHGVGGPAQGVPRNIIVNGLSTSEISISWDAPAGAIPSTYTIYRDGELLLSVPSGQTNYIDSGLEPGTAHCYFVTALVSGEESDPSYEVCASSALGVCLLSVVPSIREVPADSTQTTFTVANSGSGEMEWTVAVSNGDWLYIVDGESGVNDGTITVGYSENTGDQRVGTLVVTAEDADNSPQAITVVQAVSNPPPCGPPEAEAAYYGNRTPKKLGFFDTVLFVLFPLGTVLWLRVRRGRE